MNVIVFTGPTVSLQEVAEVIDAVCLPPVSQGDLYRAALRHPLAIGVIDGYFERVPSVWHKEILWAMSQGIYVFGSASMGALRAAELAPFGMVGVGTVFEAYRDGALEDDDEVAVAHAAGEDGYRPGSEAMVNIRATLARALAEEVLTAPAASLLRGIAKELFYPERTYPYILERATTQGVREGELDAFRRWLRQGAVNQKREDALAMLRAMREFLATNPGPMRVNYLLEETSFWDQLKSASVEMPLDPLNGPDAIVLDQLRRDAGALERAAAAALGWSKATEQARRERHDVDAATMLGQSAEFCNANGLDDAVSIAGWLKANHCTREHLERILESHALAIRSQNLSGAALEATILDYLRWTGDYPHLLEQGRSLKTLSRPRHD